MRGEYTKTLHYVLVITDNGPIFVTGVGEHKTAYWNKDEKPKDFSSRYADDMAFGLTLNGYLAYHVVNHFELDQQPYNYEEYTIDFVKKEGVKDD